MNKKLINQNELTSELSVAIGHEVAILLNLEFNNIGRTKTSWGTKSVRGLGNCIIRIVEEQSERLKEDTNQ
jgi:hypothetical protein